MIKEVREDVDSKEHGKITFVQHIDTKTGTLINHDIIHHEQQFTNNELEQISAYYGN